MNVILIGYRGSGKTTVGALLAERLWKDFVDTDDLVCDRFETDSIKRIWGEHGEAAFREAECEVVEEVLKREGQVIGLGGGTLMQERARRAVESAAGAVRIYLKCSPQTLTERIAADAKTGQTRPNLTGLGGGVEEVEAVLAEREPVYEAVADKVLNVSFLDPAGVVDHLIRRCL